MKFSRVFTDILRTQLILKNIVKPEEFDGFSDFIKYDFASDNHFTELKDAEIMRERMDTMQNVSEYVGKYFSIDYVRRNILMQSEDDIEKMNKQIEQEKNDGLYGDDEEFLMDTKEIVNSIERGELNDAKDQIMQTLNQKRLQR